MTDRSYAVIELRRLVHITLFGMVVAGGYLFGPKVVRSQIDTWVVTPVAETAQRWWSPETSRDIHPPRTPEVVRQP